MTWNFFLSPSCSGFSLVYFKPLCLLPFPLQIKVFIPWENMVRGVHVESRGHPSAAPSSSSFIPHPSPAPRSLSIFGHFLRILSNRFCKCSVGLWRKILNRLCCTKSLSRVLFATSWTVASQAPLSMGILQARTLEWVPMPSSRGSSQPRGRTQICHIAGRFFTV